jgi:leucyl aminopeptidase
MKIKAINNKELQQADHVVVLANSKKDVEKLPCDKPVSLLKEKFNDEAFQYIKTPKHLMFVINLNKLKGEDLRKKAAEILEMSKNEKEIAITSHDKEALKNFIEGFYLANYQFLKYFKDKKKKKNKIKELLVEGLSQKEIDELKNVLDSTLWARDLVNEPVSYLDAIQLAKEIKKKGEKAGLKVKVLNKKEIEKLGMGGLLAVNKGSVTPPTFTILEWKPKNAKNKKPIVLVGKGVVYDTGGLSLKPTPHSMDSMKSDMGGAAMMAATMEALAKNNVPVHVIALIPATDNRPGKNAYAPGDVVKMYDGTTVEVLNTDAEGRMILADAIAYADKYKPEVIIDAATLTGAAVRAIGDKAAIIMGNAGKSYIKEIEKAGQKTHERVVEFPFWDEWKEEMKSDIADLKNIGGGNAGMITAGKFLEHFAKQPYIHIDIAGPAFLESKQDYKGKGGTGYGVRLMYEYLKNKK